MNSMCARRFNCPNPTKETRKATHNNRTAVSRGINTRGTARAEQCRQVLCYGRGVDNHKKTDTWYVLLLGKGAQAIAQVVTNWWRKTSLSLAIGENSQPHALLHVRFDTGLGTPVSPTRPKRGSLSIPHGSHNNL